MNKHICDHGGLDIKVSAFQRMKEAGLKSTPLRKQIVEFLISSHGPFTIEQIFDRVAQLKSNLVSVYRTLSALESVGLVRKYEVGDKVSRYEYLCLDHPHHHLICTSCKKIVVIDVDIGSRLTELANQKGFASVSSSIDFFGLCQVCKNNKLSSK